MDNKKQIVLIADFPAHLPFHLFAVSYRYIHYDITIETVPDSLLNIQNSILPCKKVHPKATIINARPRPLINICDRGS